MHTTRTVLIIMAYVKLNTYDRYCVRSVIRRSGRSYELVNLKIEYRVRAQTFVKIIRSGSLNNATTNVSQHILDNRASRPADRQNQRQASTIESPRATYLQLPGRALLCHYS